jgi:hypothetical protein
LPAPDGAEMTKSFPTQFQFTATRCGATVQR